MIFVKLLAALLKLILKITPLRKYYFGLYKKVIVPYKLFDHISFVTRYDGDLKIRVALKDWIQQQIYFLDYSDLNGISFLKKTLKKGAVFIDIGANIGAYSLIAAKLVTQNGKVISFEPVKAINKKLVANLNNNNFTNVKVEKKAVYENDTFLNLHLSNEQNSGMSSILHHSEESGITEQVEAVTLDTYLKKLELESIELIKLDIEGAEIHALKGMNETILKYSPTLLIEISEDILINSTKSSANEILQLMKDYNYSLFSIELNGDLKPLENFNGKDYHNYVFQPNRK